VPLRPLPYRQVKRKLEAAGFMQVSQRGSHVKFVKHAAQAQGRRSYHATVRWPWAHSEASYDKRG